MSQQGSNGQGGASPQQQITWVGMQHLMHGYCGRAEEAPASEQQRTPTAANDPELAEVRPVAVVRTKTRQGRVVRIGPPRRAESTPAA